MSGHADDTRSVVYAARAALTRAEDVLARRAGETLTSVTTEGSGHA